ncbi:hypothetical protein [Nonomuraea sp. NPDC049695]|uniref:hypothetical protein n=1 Tax=Nonomuraea sp. NPDC049695 TaxID=3154734 RepID=UPI003443565F
METVMSPKYSLVDAMVVGHRPYGLIIRSAAGERGFVDRSHIAHIRVEANAWPPVGEQVRGVVLGRAEDGRLRLDIRKMDVELIESLTDPKRALQEWTEVETSSAETYCRSLEGAIVLRWALRHPPRTVEHARAMALLAAVSTDARRVLENDDPESFSLRDPLGGS